MTLQISRDTLMCIKTYFFLRNLRLLGSFFKAVGCHLCLQPDQEDGNAAGDSAGVVSAAR